MDPDALSKAFVEHYYSTFDTNRAGLANLYQDSSMLTFEGQKIQGSQNIVSKLTSLPFHQCKHSITTVDCQPSGPAGGMLVFVSGNLQIAGEQHALRFSQSQHVLCLICSLVSLLNFQSHVSISPSVIHLYYDWVSSKIYPQPCFLSCCRELATGFEPILLIEEQDQLFLNFGLQQ
ncbi:hypothetical protein E3N88_30385 [Mikania micrantha]|uniref:NTF2 domain-containing protein n=1 Tax=Mikania micrantha TaxID=192012 RepID=A0A5N6MLF9_9ASTR|nr:hypothetical protein E3N88_30385 [Mikania micrantha]